MRKSASTAILAVLSLLALANEALAQGTKNRWRLTYEQDKPRLYTFRSDLDKLENYWFFTYTIANPNDEVVPLLIDVMMYGETGKDLQHDSRKVDPEPTKETIDDKSKAENLKFGKFVSNVLVGEHIEYKIIEYHAKIGNRSQGIVRESIEEFKRGFVEDPPAEFKDRWSKGDRWYLNPREMRQQRFIKPGQKLMGIAIFKGVDPKAKRLEVHVSGLYDIFRVEQYADEETKLVYENRVLKFVYEFPGDEYHREADVLHPRKTEWVIKPIGPVASKDTLANLVDTLVDHVRREEEWEKDQKPAEEREKARAKFNLSPVDFNIAGRIIQLATGVNFGWDIDKTLLENQAAVWRLHEWWVKYKTKLIFNEATGRFEIKDELLPGEQRDGKK